ncbi:protein phosphatase 2C domain-containing protein [Hymenobacter sp. BT635]|uniref:Protein phosphatase 2C domain-containing protein n=2 Tax=Hymenobacter nitidus TaxID=2880929 RepID=A0ABS8AJK0_9BACT|nr:protein phosphatase 2C domain-containing protein [Hymenobacter nitidus]
MAKVGLTFFSGAATALIAYTAVLNKQRRLRVKTRQSDEATRRDLREQHAPTNAHYVPSEEPHALTLLPKAELLLSAGPRKSTRDTELGEDVTGTVLTSERIVFWVLDGTSDTVVISSSQGRDLLSSRLFCLAISAALHQLAHRYEDTHQLAKAAFDAAIQQLRNHLEEHQAVFKSFVEKEQQTPHWDVSTTMLLGILSKTGELDLFRIGDSKAICFDDTKQVVSTPIDQKPASIGLGRVYARLVRGEPMTLELYAPDRSEQLHRGHASGVRRVIAFSDGIGPGTEQYLQRMLGQRTYGQFHDGLSRTPNKTYDDKALVLVSFEAMS